MSNAYEVVMNPDRNPLQRLFLAREFQVMTYLSLMSLLQNAHAAVDPWLTPVKPPDSLG